MNITFLIGNGFDLGLGLNSRYSDFYNLYLAQSIEKGASIYEFANKISSDYKTWADFETAMGEYASNYTLSNKKELIDTIKDFLESFIKYLKKQEENLSFDNKEQISKAFSNAFKSFYSIDNLNPQSYSVISKLFKDNRAAPHTYNFIVFNYTSTFEKCIELLPNKGYIVRTNGAKDIIGQVVHVHGKIEDHPIIGVNDFEQINNKDLAGDYSFIKRFAKPEINRALRQDRGSISEKIIAESDIVCIYGMSLGKTDKIWWNKIISWLSEKSHRQLIIYIHNSNYSTGSTYEYIDIEDEIIDCLNQYTNRKNIEDLRNRIHIAVNKDIFAIDLAKKHREMMKAAVDHLKDVLSGENTV